MNSCERFTAYAAAFEEAYATDDWTLLEPFFTEDAVYEVVAPAPFGGRHAGRSAVFGYFKDSVNAFDRTFDSRKVELRAGPTLQADGVHASWTATYSLAGAPDLSMEGEERAVFEGDRIRLLEDRISEAEGQKVARYLAEHGPQS